jgi:tripartite-type tricarboxylate transporter receptor subunit TctC
MSAPMGIADGKSCSRVSRASAASALARVERDTDLGFTRDRHLKARKSGRPDLRGPSVRLVTGRLISALTRASVNIGVASCRPWVPGLASLARDTRVHGLVLAFLLAVAAAPAAHADDPFYKNKRLTILINFAPGGPTDIEGRMFAKHLARHIDGAPNIVIQNMDGAGGIVGAKYMGEVAPRDGSIAGYFTGTAFMYALDPERFRVDFKTYQFVATQAGTTVHFVRTDVAPGMKEATDIANAKGLILGGLSVDTPKDLRLRLAMDMLGIPFKYVTGYRSSPAARLAFQRGEINFFSESPPSYRGVVDPSLVKTGQAIPVFYDAGFDGKDFFVPDAVKGLPILTFHELYQKIKGTMPSGQLWDIYKAIIAADGIIQRLIVMPPGVPQPAVDALRAAIARVNVDPAYAEDAEKAFGFVPQWAAGPDTPKVAQTALTVRPEVRTFLTDYMKNLPK